MNSHVARMTKRDQIGFGIVHFVAINVVNIQPGFFGVANLALITITFSHSPLKPSAELGRVKYVTRASLPVCAAWTQTMFLTPLAVAFPRTEALMRLTTPPAECLPTRLAHKGYFCPLGLVYTTTRAKMASAPMLPRWNILKCFAAPLTNALDSFSLR